MQFSFLITVDGLNALLAESPRIPVGSEQTAVLRFTFDERWDGFAKKALFRTQGFVLEVPLNEAGECLLPELLATGRERPFYLTVEGEKDGETLNTNSLCLQFTRVRAHGRRLKKYMGPATLCVNGVYPFEDRYFESDITVAVPTAVDLENDTVTGSTLLAGYTAHDHNGEPVTGEIPTYDGATVITENTVIPTAGQYLESDLTVALPPPQPALNLAFGYDPPENKDALWVMTPTPERVELAGTLPVPTPPQVEKQAAVLGYPSVSGRTALLSCAAIGTDIYLFGGINCISWYDGREATDKIYKYNTLTGTLSDTGVFLPHPCCEMGCCAYGGVIYLFGGTSTAGNLTLPGRPASQVYDTILVFDPALGSVTDTGVHLPAPMAGLSPVLLEDRIYCLSGYSDNRTVLHKEVFYYDPIGNTVETTEGVYPEDTTGFAVVPFDGFLYCFGGSRHQEGTYSDSIFIFSPITEHFGFLGTLPTPLDVSCPFLCGDIVYLIGGMTDPIGNVNKVYAFHLETNTCTVTDVPIPVYDQYGDPFETGHTSSMYAGAAVGNTIYLFGGMEGQYFGLLNTVLAMTAGSALEPDVVTIGLDSEINRFVLSERDGIRVETGVSAVLRGVGSGSAYPVDAFLYDEEAELWVPIVSP